jgi:hypothetical protein
MVARATLALKTGRRATDRLPGRSQSRETVNAHPRR